jgi:hypothetical protein
MLLKSADALGEIDFRKNVKGRAMKRITREEAKVYVFDRSLPVKLQVAPGEKFGESRGRPDIHRKRSQRRSTRGKN